MPVSVVAICEKAAARETMFCLVEIGNAAALHSDQTMTDSCRIVDSIHLHLQCPEQFRTQIHRR
eukprot:SAG31_NODE_13842_length_843_cov_1.010753_2_plen_64_part_00